MTNALEVRGLRKSYGEKAVLKGIDLSVSRGDIFALLGVNGAGKTTALACIEGLRKYDGGTISVNGRIGIQLQSAALPAHIKGAEPWSCSQGGTGRLRTPPCWRRWIPAALRASGTRKCPPDRSGGSIWRWR